MELEVAACPHPAGPPVCWCRKPLPGLGVAFAARHRLDPARTLHVGAQPADRTFAERLGFVFVDAGRFYAEW
jgi:histidinol phosphatase-like enzyme